MNIYRSLVDKYLVWLHNRIIATKEREMDRGFLEQLKFEGYEVVEQAGEFLLVDLLGQFIDSRHPDAESLRQYCEHNVLTFLD